jgi:hypothetical protein
MGPGEGGGPDRVTDNAPPVARQLSVFQHTSSSFNTTPVTESSGGLEF